MKAIIDKIGQIHLMCFGNSNEEAGRETYKGELNYECGRLFVVVFVTLFAWLPYIPVDSEIHQFPTLAISIRLGLSLLSACLILLRFAEKFNDKPLAILEILGVYIYMTTALITATAGENIRTYMSGYILVIMMIMPTPLSTLYKGSFTAASIALFFVAGYLMGVDFTDVHIAYGVRDLGAALVLSIVFSQVQGALRYKAWRQRQDLRAMVKQDEENLKTISELAKKSEKASKAKSNFLATVSHEIRTPLNAIIGIAQIQLQKQDLPSEYISAWETTYSSGKNLLGIINDVLDMSKIETGKMGLNPTDYELPSFINDIAQLNIVQIASKPIEFTLNVDENLPLKLYGDELRLKQILNNLLSNAVKYTQSGYVKLSIDNHWANYEEIMLRFSVKDSGQGLKAEDKESLFAEYTRFNSETNRITMGTGLGLSISKNLANLMGGKIEVESEYGKGSTFTVFVKQKIAERKKIGAELSQQLCNFKFAEKKEYAKLQEINRVPMPYGKVLVVDDVEVNLEVAKGQMFIYNLQIETANSGFEAIEKIKSGNNYDIIFMDHMMPEMDGIEATKNLRKLGYQKAIVALTANAVAGSKEMFLENGFDDFISKPMDLLRLDGVLNKFVRDKHLTQDQDSDLP